MQRAKTALITGITGQDGAYLADLRLAQRDELARAHGHKTFDFNE